MKNKTYYRAKIVRCSNAKFWYAKKIGRVIQVKEMEGHSPYVECDNGASVLRHDLRPIGG